MTRKITVKGKKIEGTAERLPPPVSDASDNMLAASS
jgi:hypothetical protein